MDKVATIIVVDDDQSVRESLPEVIRDYGYASWTYESAEEFIASDDLETASCLVLDMSMPGMTGLELQIELQRLGATVPIVFITASHNDALRRTAVEKGAVACLTKPFANEELLSAIEMALASRRS